MQAQQSTATLFNRYPNVFLALQAALGDRFGVDRGGERCRILSFGCSTGAELLSLRAYFPYAEILGCDINPDALDGAVGTLECDAATVFLSSDRAIEALGPYDVILANSVLCSYPKSSGVDSLAGEFPFSAFCDLSEMLLSSLKAGGYFVLTNSNYFFRDLPSARQFQPVSSPLIEGNGFVEKFDSASRKVSRVPIFRTQRHYAHRLVTREGPYNDDDFRHCIFAKSPDKVSDYLAGAPGVGADTRLVMGGDPNDFASQGLVGAGLYRSVTPAGDGKTAQFEWRKSTISGQVVSLGPFATASDWTAEHQDRLDRYRWQRRPARTWREKLSRFRSKIA